LAASAGLTASGLTGWVLPTGDGGAAEGAQNQYASIKSSVGNSFEGLSGQFDGVQFFEYWSGTVFPKIASSAWSFFAGATVIPETQGSSFFAVALRPGDVVAAVPEPQTYALMLMGLGALLLAQRRRPR